MEVGGMVVCDNGKFGIFSKYSPIKLLVLMAVFSFYLGASLVLADSCFCGVKYSSYKVFDPRTDVKNPTRDYINSHANNCSGSCNPNQSNSACLTEKSCWQFKKGQRPEMISCKCGNPETYTAPLEPYQGPAGGSEPDCKCPKVDSTNTMPGTSPAPYTTPISSWTLYANCRHSTTPLCENRACRYSKNGKERIFSCTKN